MAAIKLASLLSTALLFISQPGWAVTAAGADKTAPAATKSLNVTPETIARGGTITAVNQQNGTISVDGISYLLPSGSLAVYSDNLSVSGSIFKLEQGMKIRFNTVRDMNGQNKVTEIWIADPGSSATRKK